MPCLITWEEHGILFSHSGTVTNEEVTAMNDIMYGDPRFEKIQYQISDYTRATEILVDIQGAKVAGTLDRASARWTRKTMKLAVVTTQEAFIKIARIYFEQLAGTGWQGKVFASLDEAHRWVKS